jgi:hypothetical protein
VSEKNSQPEECEKFGIPINDGIQKRSAPGGLLCSSGQTTIEQVEDPAAQNKTPTQKNSTLRVRQASDTAES